MLAVTPAERIETTLLIHPHVLADFADYNDFLGIAEDAIAELGLEGTVQVASFHPRYQFAGCAADDVTNATNRSPYPTLHLLREASVEEQLDALRQRSADVGVFHLDVDVSGITTTTLACAPPFP